MYCSIILCCKYYGVPVQLDFYLHSLYSLLLQCCNDVNIIAFVLSQVPSRNKKAHDRVVCYFRGISL